MRNDVKIPDEFILLESEIVQDMIIDSTGISRERLMDFINERAPLTVAEVRMIEFTMKLPAGTLTLENQEVFRNQYTFIHNILIDLREDFALMRKELVEDIYSHHEIILQNTKFKECRKRFYSFLLKVRQYFRYGEDIKLVEFLKSFLVLKKNEEQRFAEIEMWEEVIKSIAKYCFNLSRIHDRTKSIEEHREYMRTFLNGVVDTMQNYQLPSKPKRKTKKKPKIKHDPLNPVVRYTPEQVAEKQRKLEEIKAQRERKRMSKQLSLFMRTSKYDGGREVPE